MYSWPTVSTPAVAVIRRHGSSGDRLRSAWLLVPALPSAAAGFRVTRSRHVARIPPEPLVVAPLGR